MASRAATYSALRWATAGFAQRASTQNTTGKALCRSFATRFGDHERSVFMLRLYFVGDSTIGDAKVLDSAGPIHLPLANQLEQTAALSGYLLGSGKPHDRGRVAGERPEGSDQ